MSVFGYNSELRETHIQTNPVCKVSLRRVFYILEFTLTDINTLSSQRPSGHQYTVPQTLTPVATPHQDRSSPPETVKCKLE